MEKVEIIVQPESNGMRIDVFLSRHFTDVSRSAVVKALQEGQVSIQGKLIQKAGYVLKTGNVIIYEPLPAIDAHAQAEDIPVSILYQDKDLAVIDKPAGMVTHPAVGHQTGTLVNALLHHLDNLSGVGGVKRPGIVHRLDKETSGLLMVAKNDATHHALSESIQQRTVVRIYDVMVWGKMVDETLTVATQIGRDPKDRKSFNVLAEGGKRSVTHFTRKEMFTDFSLLSARLETGRTHQIRVHTRYIGLPVVGDRTYGKKNESSQMKKRGLVQPERHLLHARHLSFVHPTTQKEMEFSSSWPEDFKIFVESLG